MRTLKAKFHRLKSTERLYGMDIPIIGLTGGIATGKSTVSKMLLKQGLPVIDADALVKDVYALSGSKEFIQSICPEAIQQGEIHFPTLREKFFLDKALKVKVENYVYQHLPKAFGLAYQKLHSPRLLIYDVPLLFEKSLEKKIDLSVLVYAPQNIQRARLMQRDGHLEEMASQILQHQMDIEDKKSRADFVLNNSTTLLELEAEVISFLHQILD